MVTLPPAELRVPILVYHNIRPLSERPAGADTTYDVTPEELDAQLAYLVAQGFTSITYRDLIAVFAGERTAPEKPVMIDFDDGRASQQRYAVPLLAKHGFKATFFIFTNAPDRPGYMTWDELRALAAQGHEIGSHTVYHSFLGDRAKSEEERVWEITRSLEMLQERLPGVDIVSLAYPFGIHDERDIEVLGSAGYRAARALAHTDIIGKDDLFELPGYIITGDLARFRRIVGP